MSINDGRVISNFIVQCLQNKPITIYGNGTQTRSFCYIDDLIRGILKYSNIKKILANIAINLGNDNEYYSIKNIAYIIKNITNQSLK